MSLVTALRTFTAVCVAVACIASDAQADAVGSSVTYQGGVQHQGLVADPGLTGALHVAWRAPIAGYVSYPAIGDGSVFVTSGDPDAAGAPNRLTALDEQTGQVTWSVEVPGSYWQLHATYDAGKVFAVNWNGDIRAFDARSGALLWTTSVAGEQFGGIPIAADGRLFVTAHDQGDSSREGDQSVAAFSEATGARLWKRQQEVYGAAAALLGGRLLVGVGCPVTAAYGSADGAPGWPSDPCGAPGGEATVTSTDGDVLVTTGEFQDHANPVTVASAADGKRIRSGSPALDGAALGSGLLLLRDHTSLWAEDPGTGQRRWTWASPQDLTTPPLIVGARVYIASADGHLHALTLQTGRPELDVDLGADLVVGFLANPRTPAPGLGDADGQLLVPAHGALVALRGQPPAPTTSEPPAPTPPPPPPSPPSTPAKGPATIRLLGVTVPRSIQLRALAHPGLGLTVGHPTRRTTLSAVLRLHAKRLAVRVWTFKHTGRRHLRLGVRAAVLRGITSGTATLTLALSRNGKKLSSGHVAIRLVG